MSEREVRRRSPDRRYAVVFTPGPEVSMMRYAHDFRLEDAQGRAVQGFRELSTPGFEAKWSPDSRFVAVSVSDDSFMLVFDVQRRRFALIVFNGYLQRMRLTTRAVRVTAYMTQFRLLFGKRFSPPRPNVHAFDALRWHPAPKVWDLRKASRTAAPFRWLPPPGKALRAFARKHHISLE